MYRSEMLDAVRAGLERAKGNWPRICRELDIEYSWVCKVAQGQIPNPGVRDIERLHKYLSVVYPVRTRGAA